MLFERCFKESLKKMELECTLTWKSADLELLLGAQLLFEVTGDKQYLKNIQRFGEAHLNGDGKIVAEKGGEYGFLLSFLYELTGVDLYKKGAIFMAHEISPDVFGNATCGKALPFYLYYDVHYGGKQHFNEILKQLNRLENLADSDTEFAEVMAGQHLATLIDCCDMIPEESYEQYRAIEAMFKAELRKILRKDRTYLEAKESALISYAIFKGCRLGVLQKEKYFSLAEDMLAALEAKIWNWEIREEKGNIAACMLAYGEWNDAI